MTHLRGTLLTNEKGVVSTNEKGRADLSERDGDTQSNYGAGSRKRRHLRLNRRWTIQKKG